LRAWLALVLFWSGADPRLRDRYFRFACASTGRGRRRLQRAWTGRTPRPAGRCVLTCRAVGYL